MLLTDNLDIVGVTSDGGLWHAKLVRGQGDTMPWEDIKRVQGAVEPAPFVRTDCTLWQEALHICVVSQDGKLWYEAPGQPLEDMSSHFDGSLGAFQDVSLTEFGGDLHVCAVAASVDIIDPGTFVAVDCASVEERLGYQRHVHVCGVTQDGLLWYKMNFVEPAVPQSFESVADKIQAPGPFVSVGAANSTDSLGQTSIPLTNCSSLQNQINALCGVVPRTPSNRHRIQVLLAEGRRIRCTLTVPGGCLS